MILSEKSIIYQTLDDSGYNSSGEYVYQGDYTSKTKSDIIKEIFYRYFPDITDFSQIETDSTSVQKSYFEIPFGDIIEDLCGNDKYFYLDYDLVPHYFTKGSRVNTTEIVTSDNLVTLADNADNGEEIYTRVRVYGQSEDGIPVIGTYNIGTSNTSGIDKDYIINNSSVVNTTQANALAESEANNLTESTKIGQITSLILPSLNPGESFFISIPEENISPAYYNVKEFTIEIDNQGDFAYKTIFNIETKRVDLSKTIKTTIQTQSELASNDNPNDLDYSRIITFEEDSGTHYGTTISENYLKVTSGGSTGYWESEIFTLGSNVSAIEIRWSGDLLVGDYTTTSSQLWFSLNGGATWKLNPTSGTISSIPVGKDLRVKVVLNQSSAKVKRIGVYYNL
ncbi:MAG: hypothetical protein ACFFG0_03175 [Candidatus Thorarchaeota archaeon]